MTDLGALLGNGMAFDPHAAGIRLLIKRLVGRPPLWTEWAEVKSVDAENWQAVVEVQADEGEFDRTVWLTPVEAGSATAFVPVPKVGSMVIIMRLGRTDQWCIIQCQELESMYMMGDKYGTVKAEELIDKVVERLNRLEEKMATHQHSYVAGVTPAITTPDPASNSPLTPTTSADFKSIINDKIKHGS